VTWLTPRSLAGAAAALFVIHGGAAAQRSVGGRDTASYEVSSVSFEGNELLSDRELRNFIATEPTRCKSLVVLPGCVLTRWRFFEVRHEINRIEVGRDVVRIRAQYYLRGYRAATVDTIIDRSESGAADITFVIKEGAPLPIADISVNRPQGVFTDEQLHRLLGINAGEPLNLITLDSARARLRDELWERGHSDALIRMDTSMTSAGMNVVVEIDPRWISRVDAIQVSGNVKIESQTIKNSMFLEVGKPFLLSDLERSQRALYESGLFTRADVNVVGDSSKLIIVDVDEARLRLARIGMGVSTVEFFQVEGQLTNFNWMGGARRVSLNMNVGNLLAPQLNGRAIFRDALDGISAQGGTYLSPTWRASGDLRIPWFYNPRNEIALSAFAQRRSLPGIFVDRSLGLSAVFTREVSERLPVSLGYQFELTRVDAGDLYFCVNFGICDPPTIAALRSTRSLSPVTLSATMERTDDPISATRGYNLRASFEHSSSYTFSDYRYNRVQVDAAQFFPVFGNSVLALHLRGGWVGALGSTDNALGVDSEGRTILHPRKKFFAGGSQSVRGFGEAQLGPRILTVPPDVLAEAGCEIGTTSAVCDHNLLNDRTLLADTSFAARPLGGNVLVEGSAELRFPIFRNLGGAIFMDAALVGERGLGDLKQSTIAVAPGFGFRYASLAGPIRIDLGYNPFLTEDLPVVTTVMDGVSTLITTLQSPRPSDGALTSARRTFTPPRASGFLGFLSLFTLHLSIGQAF
jgi:outer membrane protein assembly factor BamA